MSRLQIVRARAAVLGGLLPFLFASDCRSSPPPDSDVAEALRRSVVRVGQQILEALAATFPLVNRPYFDDGATLRWDTSAIGPLSTCPGEAPATERMTLMVAPRVDRVRCAGGGGTRATTLLVGIKAGGEERPGPSPSTSTCSAPRPRGSCSRIWP